MDDFRDALCEVEPSSTREVYVEVPDVHWQDVGGLAQIGNGSSKPSSGRCIFASVREGGDPASEGYSAGGPARLREDAARQSHRHGEQGEFHFRERARAAVEVRRGIRAGREGGLS